MEENKTIRISVRSLVEFLLREGDIDNRKGGVSDKDAMAEGSRAHRRIQGRMRGDYQAEVPLSARICWDECVLLVEGRADGIFTEDNLVYIDEIKGVYRDVMALQEPVPVHLAQAKCYAYLYASEEELASIGVQMTYCSLQTDEVRRMRRVFTTEELADWFQDLTEQYHRWAKLKIDWEQTRQTSIQNLEFPYPWREGQRDVASSVYRTIVRGKKLFIQAPTGTGKTLSTVFPAVKAIGEGLADGIFYATAKTVTRRVAEEAFDILRGNGLRMKTVTLTARERICFLGEPACNPDACPYAKGHFDRVNDAVYELVSTQEALTREVIEEQAAKWQVCPFEMGLDVSAWTDAVICDYNYIFDPRAKLKRFFGEGAKGNYLFLIDEAHNLVERGREMYSASLYKEDFLALRREIRSHSRKITRALSRCNTWLLEQKKVSEQTGEQVRLLTPGSAEGGLGTFPLSLMNLMGQMEDFLDESKNEELNEKVLDLYFQVSRFVETCDRLDENYVIYTERCEDGRFLLRLFCVDISLNLQECLDRGRSTIYFSATLLPIRYYKSLLSTRKDDYAIYAQPVFDSSNRRVLIGTDTTTRYTRRGADTYRRMAEYVREVMQAKRGNYMIFFPSYQMMDAVADEFEALIKEQSRTSHPKGADGQETETGQENADGQEAETGQEAAAGQEAIGILRQTSGMREQEREDFLAQFEENHPQGLAGFCVMGGIFGEGIDLREDRLIGVIVVGTGIPQICNEREVLKDFYDKRGEDGFFYAYLCPGMNRVLQAAGRVIRTETDEGVILLLDERFDSPRYRSMFPAEWEQPDTCTISTVREKLEGFWERPR